MDLEEEKKMKIFNSTTPNITTKKRYFRVEKKRFNPDDTKEKDSKKIFKTKKEYHMQKKKASREFRRIKFHKNNKFVTTMKDNLHINSGDNDNNSFVVKKIFPKKLKVIKEQKKESKHFDYFSNQKDKMLFNDNSILFKNQNLNFNLNNISKENEKQLNNIKIKLMPVYFYSIKNLCKYINNNFFNTSLNEQKVIDELIYQIYQSLQILDRKINEFKIFQNIKDDIRVKSEDFYDISSLKENLLLMKNVLNNSMSQNLINIYIDIDNFCKLFS